ncbi:hypothetical protein [Xenorhabdus sp. TH1]|uniref:hypothetical protein n=1 Tax=Xenorhabdus sp. TH1 TaxID=3130166 RepID=UPI0030CBC74B
MAGKLNLIPPSGNIIKGQPFLVAVSITDETGITDTTKIDVVLPQGVTLIKKFPGSVARGVFNQQMVFQADESATDHEIIFTADSTSKPTNKATYHPVDNPVLKPETCVLRGASAYLYDSNPAKPGADITGHPYVSASINPMTRLNKPISSYDIPLRTTAPLRIIPEGQNEVQPYQVEGENQYYYYLINKPSETAVNLKIYATEGLSQFVAIETIFSEIEYNQKETIFVNTDTINTSSSFEPPTIEETYSSSTLTRQDQTDNFHFMIPNYPGAKPGNFIIGFVSDDQTNFYKKQLCIGQLKHEHNGYYKIPADYGNLYDGDNFISYVGLDQYGNTIGSKPNYISYDSGGNNSPDPDDKNRTLVAPELYDQFKRFIGIYQSVNIYSIGQKGLEVRLPIDPTQQNQDTIVLGDMIMIKAYISYCIDTTSPPRPLPIIVANSKTVKKSDVDRGYFKATIKPEQLLGYDSSDDNDGTISIDYLRVASGQKSKLFIRSIGTVAP